MTFDLMFHMFLIYAWGTDKQHLQPNTDVPHLVLQELSLSFTLVGAMTSPTPWICV